MAILAPAKCLPASTERDTGQFLDVDMDQLTGPVSLIAARRLRRRGPIADIKTPKPGLAKDRLNRRRCQADLMGDVVGTPPVLLP